MKYLLVLGGSSKHGDKSFDKILGIGILDLLINLISCRWFLKNINSVVVLKCPKRMLGYYFSKGFTILECNNNNLAKVPNEVKEIIHAEETDNSDSHEMYHQNSLHIKHTEELCGK